MRVLSRCFLLISCLAAYTLSVADLFADAPARPALRIGVPSELPPLSFHVDRDKAMRGLVIDFGELLRDRLDRTVIFMDGGPGRLARMLKYGRIDCIVGIPSLRLSPNADDIVFTPLALNRRIITCQPASPISSEADFAGRKILLTAYDLAYGATIRRNGGTVVVGGNMAEALTMLHSGQADAFVSYSGEVARSQAQLHGIGHLKITGVSLGRIPITIQVSPDNEHLRSELTTALVELENAGELDLLRGKWLGMEDKSLWERYRAHIWSGLCLMLVLAVLSVIWIVTLRGQVFRMTRALRRSEHRFRELFAGSPDIALLLDPDGRIHLANRAAKDMLELGNLSYCGSTALLDSLNQEGRQDLLRLLQDCPQTTPDRATITIHPGTGKARIIEFLAFATDAGEATHPVICCLGRDLTMRKRLEKELIEAERLAIIGKTTACVAHEINNPLGIIMANTGVLLEEDVPPEQRRMLEAISRNVERAAATTRRMLKIAMPKETNMAPQNLRELMEETLQFMGPYLKNVTVDSSRLPAELPILGDRTMLQQVFTNLTLNALNSMDHSGTLRISGKILQEAPPEAFERAARQTELIDLLEAQMQSERWVLMEIADTGRGIDPEHLDRLFDPFFTTRGEQGFGLGLWISRRIVELHKGLIYAQSEPGHGAVMTMVFAQDKVEEAAEVHEE